MRGLSTRPVVALNIRSAEADSLATEVASLAGETKTHAVIVALKERRPGPISKVVRSGRCAEAPLLRLP